MLGVLVTLDYPGTFKSYVKSTVLKVECLAECSFFHDHNFVLKCHIHNSSALCFDVQPY